MSVAQRDPVPRVAFAIVAVAGNNYKEIKMIVTSRKIRIGVALVVAALTTTGLAGCSSSDDDAKETTTTAKAAAKSTIGVGDTPAGKVLVNSSGQTMYLYEPDGTGAPTCTDSCAGAWPPVFAEDGAVAGDGVSAVISTVKDADGKQQITVNGRPAYLFAADAASGESKGQGQGGVWFVFDAKGDKVPA